MWPRDEAKQFFAGQGRAAQGAADRGEDRGAAEVSCYTIKDRDTFVDFCVGPARAVDRRLKAFKLLSTSNAYWKGDAKNQPMQRIYGTAFFSEKDLQAHLQRIEEAKKRDHRKLGKDLGLFTFHPWAPGATFWLGKGTTLYNTLADYMREVLFPAGYVELKTPLIFNKALWETSGHWEHYRENMFLVEGRRRGDGREGHELPRPHAVFASEMRSYRDLPLRFHEQTPLHRNEASGVLSGLTRVRQFSQDDAHCFVTEEQIGGSGAAAAARAARVRRLRPEYEAKLSTRPAEFLGEIATWDHAEAALRQALDGAGQPYTPTRGTARSTGRRSTSTSPTRSAGSGSARRSSSTTRCRSAST
jgi:threonyl-tRNA synthetase